MPKAQRIYYHGTSQKEWEAIQREGLIPGKGHGADYWAQHAPKSRNAGGVVPVRTPSVYLSETIHHAEFFARMAAEDNKSKPVVLVVTLDTSARLIEDEEDADTGSYRYVGTIPASQIAFHHAVLGARKAVNYGPFFSFF